MRVATKHYFFLSVVSVCLFYFGFELFFNSFSMISVDEFWFAHRTYEYKNGLPYRDFAPYKTVLGYYLLLLPLLVSKGTFTALITVKNAIALLNTFVLLGVSLGLKRFFTGRAVLSSLLLLVTAEIVLSYSTNIRVDLLGYWFCFFSLLCLLHRRFWFAGFLLALGFLTTQKAIWYVFATNCALGMQMLILERNLKSIANIFRVNIALMTVILVYLLAWSFVADFHTVIESVFFEASAMYSLDWYDSARKLFWSLTTLYNPLLFLLWPLSVLTLFVTYEKDENYAERLLVVVYGCTILCCLIPYKQVFLYYMQVTIPAFFVLYTAFFNWLFNIFKPNRQLKLLVGERSLWLMLGVYLLTLILISAEFQLPDAYLLLALIPILLTLFVTRFQTLQSWIASLFYHLIIITLIFVGGIYPLTTFVIKLINLEGSYQKANILAINALLQDGSDYVAGIELIYDKTQPIAGMRHLMGPAIDYLYHPSEKIRPVMLASLYEDPNVTAASVIAALEKSNVKFYVNNYRMNALPETIKNYLDANYAHWWGSIYLYAPQIPKGKQTITLKFTGKYHIQSAGTNSITLNSKKYLAGNIFYLKKGKYTSFAHADYRLQLMPEKFVSADPLFNEDNSDKLIFS